MGAFFNDTATTEIYTHSALVATVATYRAGDTVTLKLMRDHKEMELQLTFAEQQPTTASTQESQPAQQPAQQPSGGSNGSYYYQWPFGSFFNFPF